MGLNTNKAIRGNGIPAELFQILKDDAIEMLHSMCQNARNMLLIYTQYTSKFGKLRRTGKGQFSFQSQRKAMLKNAQTTAQLHSSHILAK